MPENGGLPTPAPDLPTRVLAAHHGACGTETRVRVPHSVPAHAVRRVVCSRCAQPFMVDSAVEVGLEAPVTTGAAVDHVAPGAAVEPGPAQGASATGMEAPAETTEPAGPVPSPGRRRLPRLPEPESPVWRWAGIPIAAVAVVAGVSLVTGSGGDPAPDAEPQPSAFTSGPATDPAPAARPRRATLVREPTFTLALPAGWQRVRPSGGAAFAARAPGGGADATLWVERDPKLSFAEFEQRSIAQMKALTGQAPRVERTPGPTPERSAFTLIAPAPRGAPSYVATGRLAGPYRYYLATTVQSDAPPKVAAAAELVRESFVPEGGR